MMKSIKLFALSLAIAVAGCATTGTGVQSPESQILTGANAVTATATLATVLLRNDKITVEQAKGFRVLLGGASSALDSANAALLACRAKTGVFTMTADPCRPQVTDLVVLALDTVAGVKTALDKRASGPALPGVKTLGADAPAAGQSK